VHEATARTATRASIGDHLRRWRAIRGTSQLDLASDAETTPRYLSFVETGRAQPSRQMVLRLARALDVPLRERNDLLMAAGFAPLYSVEPLSSPSLARVDRALDAMLDHHDPFPAVVMNRQWDLQRANEGAVRLFTQLFEPHDLPASPNILRTVIEPGPVRSRIRNWGEVVPALLDRARREAVGGVLDDATAALVDELQARDDVAPMATAVSGADPSAPVVDLQLELDREVLSFFSVVSTIGTPADVTAQEIRVEAFFPSDDGTTTAWLGR
jgi:transcriptional regulator with XRE-family HTH domain